MIVAVTGMPGTGKSTLADPLATELALPLVTKDRIKEALFDALGTGDRAWSRALSEAAYAVIERMLCEYDACVLDANLRPEHARILGSAAPSTVEIRCRCSRETMRARLEARIGTRHPGHLDALIADEIADQIADEGTPDPGPLVADAPYLVVDTERSVDVSAIARWVRATAQWNARAGQAGGAP